MNDPLREETSRLARSWHRHDAAMLRSYLVEDVEDPRLNVQSILTRHFLLRSLFGEAYGILKLAEVDFAIAMNWLLRLVHRGLTPDDLAALRHALHRGADDAEGIQIPSCIVRLNASLPATIGDALIPNYLETFLASPIQPGVEGFQRTPALNTFQLIWRHLLAGEVGPRLRVLEVACGSANDYRFLESYGLARWIDYVGIDLCEKNVENARALFPEAHFEVGNVFGLAAPDDAYDVAYVHDLFEHLSLAGFERAVGELCRVTRTAMCLGFFNMHEEEDHIVRQDDDYHWNTLSLPRTTPLFEQHGFGVTPVHIGTLLRWRHGCDATHNPNAYMLEASWMAPSESDVAGPSDPLFTIPG